MADNTTSNLRTDARAGNSGLTLEKWGGLASFALAVAFFIPPIIHLFGNLRTTFGPLAYDLADFLYGPVWAASLVVAVVALREVLGEHAPRRMSLALLAAGLAAGAMVAVACIRSANRHYHLDRPDLHLESASTVLLAWTTIIAGLSAAGWHFLGWTLILVGSAGWTSNRLPRLLSVLYLAGGAVSLFVYLWSEFEGLAMMLAVIVSIWQGILLWRAAVVTNVTRAT
jgi:hypothetical protein